MWFRSTLTGRCTRAPPGLSLLLCYNTIWQVCILSTALRHCGSCLSVLFFLLWYYCWFLHAARQQRQMFGHIWLAMSASLESSRLASRRVSAPSTQCAGWDRHVHSLSFFARPLEVEITNTGFRVRRLQTTWCVWQSQHWTGVCALASKNGLCFIAPWSQRPTGQRSGSPGSVIQGTLWVGWQMRLPVRGNILQLKCSVSHARTHARARTQLRLLSSSSRLITVLCHCPFCYNFISLPSQISLEKTAAWAHPCMHACMHVHALSFDCAAMLSVCVS